MEIVKMMLEAIVAYHVDNRYNVYEENIRNIAKNIATVLP